MKGIDLRPAWYREKLYYRAFIKKAAAVSAAVFVCLFFTAYLLDGAVSKRESALSELTAETENEKYIESDEIAGLVSAAEPAGEYARKDGGLAIRLDLIESAAPAGVTFNEIGYTGINGRFTFTGKAADGADITAFLDKLGDDFYDVSLNRLSGEADGEYAFNAEFYAEREDTR